jgi:hypothetical protein
VHPSIPDEIPKINLHFPGKSLITSSWKIHTKKSDNQIFIEKKWIGGIF